MKPRAGKAPAKRKATEKSAFVPKFINLRRHGFDMAAARMKDESVHLKGQGIDNLTDLINRLVEGYGKGDIQL